MSHRPAPPPLDLPLLSRWIEPLAKDGFADLFFEWKSELHLSVQDGSIGGSMFTVEGAVSARARRGSRVVLTASPRADEAGARDAVRRLAAILSSSNFPKSAENPAAEPRGETEDPARWTKKISALISRAFENRPHRVEVRRRHSTRLVVPAGRPPSRHDRPRLSLHGEFLGDTRGGPRWRAFNFHLPEADDGAFEELRQRLRSLAAGGPGPVPPTSGATDVILENGSGAFFFHEVLSHPLEADAPASRLANLSKARLCPREIEVADEPSRLDLFGGYPVDDEGVPARRTPLLSAGHLAGPLRDRLRSDPLHPSTGNGRRPSAFDHAAPRGSNLVVGPGGASEEEMLHRLGTGIRIEEFDGGSVDPASGRFRLRFPAAQAVQRGRLGQPLGPGHLEGEVVEALAAVDPLLGARAKACRQLAWCAREGKILPVGGEAPAMIVRRMQVSPR
ncbi:MAG TPA: TldD/PmbA family protein [Thermoanaerobaculia bacterium]|nr:TldD/PmbA family protein [Thermoanaerobaculia bacterium]